jgi:hypothetical protein
MFVTTNLLFMTLAPVLAYTIGALILGFYQSLFNAPEFPISSKQISQT